MKTKTKISIGVLIVGIVLISGLFILPEIFKDKTCTEDSDCVKVCEDCWCFCGGYTDVVNKKSLVFLKIKKFFMSPFCKLMEPFRPMVSCVPLYLKENPVCINKKCATRPSPDCGLICLEYQTKKENEGKKMFIKLLNTLSNEKGLNKTAQEILEMCNCFREVTITTDKTEYKQGEEVKIIAINNLGKSIWYAKRLDGCKGSFWELEKFAKGKWKKVVYHPFVLCEISDFGFTELESKEKLEEIWDGYVWISEESKEYKRKTADSGKYRVIFYYSLENISRFDRYFKKRIKIYSNEFIIKKPTSKKCIPEGGTLFPNDGNKCCVGLSPRWNYEMQEDGSCKSISGSSGRQLICVKCGNGVCGEGENGCNCPKDCKDFKCKEHGEIPIFFPGNDMSIQCCKGLKHRLQKEYFDENCTNLFEKYGGGGYAGICLACGDGICDEKFESKCNCPEDCK